MLLLDLDHFQVINDGLGHVAGDAVLEEVARRLSTVVRSGETVARLGGDEFALLLEDVADVAAAVKVARRVMEALGASVMVGADNHEAVVTASIGIVLAGGNAGADDVLRDADTAMNRAKAAGRARYEIFEEEQYRRSLERLTMEGDLRRALVKGEFCLHYQPVVDLRTGQLAGAEALVRWRHPTRGLLAPMEFVPLAEETGLIVGLGEYVMRAALAQLTAWDADEDGAQVPEVSVNFSAVQLADPGLGAKVRRALDDSGVSAERLGAEVTETVFMADSDTTRASVAELRRLGVSIGIDDFGTGYSSLAYLQTLPAGFLKIDRRFTEGLGTGSVTETIVAAVVDIAHALELEVVAEGVEEVRQLEFLTMCGCDSAQGYLWARPMPPGEFAAWARSFEARLNGTSDGISREHARQEVAGAISALAGRASHQGRQPR